MDPGEEKTIGKVLDIISDIKDEDVKRALDIIDEIKQRYQGFTSDEKTLIADDSLNAIMADIMGEITDIDKMRGEVNSLVGNMFDLVGFNSYGECARFEIPQGGGEMDKLLREASERHYRTLRVSPRDDTMFSGYSIKLGEYCLPAFFERSISLSIMVPISIGRKSYKGREEHLKTMMWLYKLANKTCD